MSPSDLYLDIETVSSIVPERPTGEPAPAHCDDPLTGKRSPHVLVYDEARASALRSMASGAGEADPAKYGALCPPLARVVCIGMYSPASSRYAAIVDGSLVRVRLDVDRDYKVLISDGEADVLARFDEMLGKVRRLVTFNGRSFDVPVLAMRYAVNRRIAPRLLMSAATEPRFKAGTYHRDLAEEMTFQGAARKFPLRALALAMGVADPKAHGDGGGVAELVAAGDGDSLMTYCVGDVRALVECDRPWQGMV